MGNNLRTVGMKSFSKTVTVPGTAERIMAVDNPDRFVTSFEVYTGKTSGSSNSGNIFIGDSTVDNTWIPRAPGTYSTFSYGVGNDECTPGFDLSKFWIDAATAGDGIIVQYYRLASDWS